MPNEPRDDASNGEQPADEQAETVHVVVGGLIGDRRSAADNADRGPDEKRPPRPAQQPGDEAQNDSQYQMTISRSFSARLSKAMSTRSTRLAPVRRARVRLG
jgi:hypothetical protein